MAQCDAGYFCRVCGRYVDDVTSSALYLRYVLREVSFEQLFIEPDAHIWCDPELAQYIVDEAYQVDPGADPASIPDVPVHLRKQRIDPEEVREREERVTRAWRRLQEIPESGWTIQDYPLPD
jgi:hypothetical protein